MRFMMENHKKLSGSVCRCCMHSTQFFSSAEVLHYEADYYQCTQCGSVQIEEPHWLEEAHSAAISILDTGLVARCLSASRLISVFLFLEGRMKSSGIDWGGGTGLLTRMLRDLGFEMLSFDKYMDGQHSRGFNINESELGSKKDFLTAIECFEHLEDPITLLVNAVEKKQYFIFTTEVLRLPAPDPAARDWWYFMPESGQHITFATNVGLQSFTKQLGFNYLISFGSLHVMSRHPIKVRTKSLLQIRPIRQLLILFIPELMKKRRSLTVSDKNLLTKDL